MQVPSSSPVPHNKPPAPRMLPRGLSALQGQDLLGSCSQPASVLLAIPSHRAPSSSPQATPSLFVSPFLLFAKPTSKSQPVLQPVCTSPSLVASANVISSSCPITQTANGNTDEAQIPD